jgi:hypothetical protein
MLRKWLSGSELRSVAYDKEKQVLEIEFHNGWVYHYYKVPPYIHRKLISATSHDSYYNNFIKNVFSFTKVG